MFTKEVRIEADSKSVRQRAIHSASKRLIDYLRYGLRRCPGKKDPQLTTSFDTLNVRQICQLLGKVRNRYRRDLDTDEFAVRRVESIVKGGKVIVSYSLKQLLTYHKAWADITIGPGQC